MGNGFQSELKSALDEPMREMRETADLVKKAADPALVAEESETEARLRSEADAAMLAATLDTPVSDASSTISDSAAADEITSANGPKINQIILNGDIKDSSIIVVGKSLIHSAELTSKAFGSGVLGKYGEYIVAIGLLLFAFSTAIAWSYYGDRSTAYIFGENAVPWYRMIYVLCFIAAAIIDTTVVWNIAYVVVALVTIPNLFALFILRKEMKDQVSNYVIEK